MPDFKAIAQATVDRLSAEGRVSPSEARTVRAVLESELARAWAARRVAGMAVRQVAPVLRDIGAIVGRALETVAEDATRAGRE